MAKSAQLDLSSFMCVILMLIGVLMIMLISNVITIISNPENVQISALIKGALYAEEDRKDEDSELMLVPKFQNKMKTPTYLDVYGDHIIIYPEGQVVHAVDLERPGNPFERVLNDVAEAKNERYLILLARPHSARLLRRLRTAIKDREVDLGFELYEEGRVVDIGGTETPEQAAAAAAATAESGAPTPAETAPAEAAPAPEAGTPPQE